MEWFPIETAPKDGTDILGCFALNDGAKGLSIVQFDGEDWMALSYTSPSQWPETAYTGHEEPVYFSQAEMLAWMPLPAPPTP